MDMKATVNLGVPQSFLQKDPQEVPCIQSVCHVESNKVMSTFVYIQSTKYGGMAWIICYKITNKPSIDIRQEEYFCSFGLIHTATLNANL